MINEFANLNWCWLTGLSLISPLFLDQSKRSKLFWIQYPAFQKPFLFETFSLLVLGAKFAFECPFSGT